MNATQKGIIGKLEAVKTADNETSVSLLQKTAGRDPAAARGLISDNPELAVLVRELPFVQILIETL